jgi:NADPH:quinone reductase-like Zn-dependent oxidoreductase
MAGLTMKTVQIQDYGAAEALQVKEVPIPQPEKGQVLVKLLAAGVNPADWKIRAGYFKQYMPLTFPWTPGMEAAGVVEAVGEGVTQFKPGQSVFGIVNGGYAQYALASAADVFPQPKNLSVDQAASISAGALTAWAAVIDSGQVSSGQRVLVHGAAGGVGLFALQLAKWKGAYVIATASAGNAALVKSLGADEVIDYQKTAFETAVKDIDVVIDTVGGDLPERSLKVLRPGGKYITTAGMIAPEFGKAEGIHAVSANRAPHANLVKIIELLENGTLKPVVGKVFPLSQAHQAQMESETGHGQGRIILHTAE